MFKLGKKGAPRAPAADRVADLSRQGYADMEIIRSLRKEGYSPGEADAAMRQAVRTAAVPSPPRPERQEYDQEFSRMPRPEPVPDFPELPGIPAPERSFPGDRLSSERLPPEPPTRPPRDAQEEDLGFEEEFIPQVGKKPAGRGDLEETVEGVVEEKWTAFQHEIEEINERFEKVNQRITAIEASLAQFRGVKKDDVEHIRGAIDSYKESMDEVSSRMEAMERAVKDSMTPMMQSLRSLSDTLQSMKRGS